MSRQTKKRMVVVFALMAALFFAVIARLFYLQVVAADDLKDKGVSQQMREVPVAANRGTIYDRNYNMMAVSVSVDSVYASPTEISAAEAPAIAASLSTTLGLEEEAVLAKLTSGRSYEWIKRKVREEEAAAIRELELQGIGITTETKRSYPKGTLLCDVLGFAGLDNQGLEGMEALLDETLQGTDGYVLAQYDSHGKEIAGSARSYVEPIDGNSVILTIDESIQYFAERELDALMESSVNPAGAYIIVMAPKTGEILALAGRPAYDPNDFAAYDSALWRNNAISDFYEPGSTAKILTISAALEENVVSESDTFYDSGSITVGGKKIRCWATSPHGSQTFVEVAENSCNPAFVEVGQRIDQSDPLTFYRYLQAFGIGQKTGVTLPGESAGSLRQYASAEDVNVLDIANMYIGQGYGVTALQLVTAVSAAVNGGVLMKPYIVKSVVNPDGDTIEHNEPTEVNRVISAETSRRVCQILESVVANGTGNRAYIEGYRVGGKTGTAQKFIDGAYSKSKYVASFIGVAPADDPELVCLVVVDEPGSYPIYGGTIAAPVFQRVMSDALRYLGVEPRISENSGNDGTAGLSEVVVPAVTGLSLEDAKSILADSGLTVRESGSGAMVANQVPAALTRVYAGSEVLLTLGDQYDDTVELPDLRGLRMLACGEALQALGLIFTPEGSGEAVSQEPAAGTRVKRGSAVTVVFEEANEATVETIAP